MKFPLKWMSPPYAKWADKMRDMWIVTLMQRSCVDMPWLFDSVPNDTLRDSLISPPETSKARPAKARRYTAHE
jgi:hypothetical protein